MVCGYFLPNPPKRPPGATGVSPAGGAANEANSAPPCGSETGFRVQGQGSSLGVGV